MGKLSSELTYKISRLY